MKLKQKGGILHFVVGSNPWNTPRNQGERAETDTQTVSKKDMDKLNKLHDVLKTLVKAEFTGSIKVNFSQGGISRVEKFEEILKKKDKE